MSWTPGCDYESKTTVCNNSAKIDQVFVSILKVR